MRLFFITALLIVAVEAEECPDPDSVQLPSGCDPDDPAETNLNRCFSQNASVFGIRIWAQEDVPLWAFAYSVNVASKLFDNDEDGLADDPNMIAQLTSQESEKRGMAVLACRGGIGQGALKDSFWAVTRTELQETLTMDFKRQTIEEFHHASWHGYELAYPDVFGTDNTSELAVAVQEAYGDCEDSSQCADTAGGCSDYQCSCPQAECDDIGQYECSFIANSCTGVYHYPTPSCTRGCQITEGFYWAWTTAYGWQEESLGGNCSEIMDEWEMCSPEDMEDKTPLLYQLVTGASPSRTSSGYVLPTIVPDGSYNATANFETSVSHTIRLGCFSIIATTTSSLLIMLSAVG